MKQIPFLILAAFAFYGVDCRREEPCLTCPTPAGDTLITFERELADGEQPAVSPDGKKIAYTHNGDIFVMDTSVQTTVWWDGQNWRYDTTGGIITQLTSGAEIDILPRWAPDGQTVGFVRLQTVQDDDGIICNVPLTGGNVTQLLHKHFVSNGLKKSIEQSGVTSMPIWDFSPDGNHIAFISTENDSDFLNVVNFPLGTPRVHEPLFSALSTYRGSCFSWSLNSNEIAFIAGENQWEKSAQLLNFENNTLLKDSLTQGGNYLTRITNKNKFAYTASSSSGSMVIFSDFHSAVTKVVISPSPGYSLKISPNEKLLLFQKFETKYDGPFTFRYNQFAIYDLDRKKEYIVRDHGDVTRVIFYFEWGKASDIVFYETAKKIRKTTFKLP